MTILGLDHAQITIPKGTEEQARQYYCELLGLKEIEKPASLQGRGGFWLEVGTQAVHVGTEDGVNRLATKAHLAYRVSNLTHWQERLTENGFEVIEGIPIPGFTRFESRDPFGNRLEFIQPLS
jgi:catechol 2,3-dioxygenase-like lactoylglutathione lyase family enzyme